MTPDPLTRAEAELPDPVIAATLKLSAVQSIFDAILLSGRGLPIESRRWLAVRLADARAELREAIYGEQDSIDETATLTYMLPALEPACQS